MAENYQLMRVRCKIAFRNIKSANISSSESFEIEAADPGEQRMAPNIVDGSNLATANNNKEMLLDRAVQNDISMEDSLRELNWYQYFAKVQSVPELTRTVRIVIHHLGFSDFSYHRTECNSTDDACMVTTPRRLSEYYDGEGAWKYDPVLHHCAHKATPIFRSVVNRYIENAPFETETFVRLMKLKEYTAKIGFYDYYHRSIKTTNGNGNAVLALTTRNLSVEDFQVRVIRQESNIDMLLRVIDYVGTLKFPQHFMNEGESREVIIRPRLLSLLDILAKSDLSLAEAADSLCISESTVNKHIATLKKAFEVKTLWGALYKAIKIGLIS